MTMLSPNNYYTVAGWMLTELGLRGNELTAYAVIYGFSQVEDHRFHGSVSYLAEWMGVSRSTAIRALNSLVERGLLAKYEREVNGVKFPEYAAVVPSKEEHKCDTPCQNDIGGCVKMTHNNIDIYTDSNITPALIPSSMGLDNTTTLNNPQIFIKPTEEDGISAPPTGSGGGKRDTYSAIKNLYNEICVSLPKCKVLTEERKRSIKARLAEGFTQEMFGDVFRKAEASSFLKGGGSKGFVASFDFLVGTKAAKVLEGVYDDDPGADMRPDPMAKYEMSDEEFDRLFAVKEDRDALPD